MSRNINKIYLASFFSGLMFYYGIERLYLFSIGSDQSVVGFLPVITAAVVLIFDVPLGYVADRIGRKNTLIFAMISLALAGIIFSLANNVYQYAFGIIAYGFFLVGVSGSFQSLIYDTLHEQNLTSMFNKVLGRAYSALFIGQGIAVFSSGFLAQAWGFQLNYQLGTLSAIIALIILLFVNEPKYHKLDMNLGWKNHINNSFKIIGLNQVLKQSILIVSVIGIVIWLSNDYSQFIFNEYGTPLWLVSILSGLAMLASIIGRLFAHKLSSYVGVALFIMLVLFGLVGWAPQVISLASLILYYGFASSLANNSETMIQHRLPSNLRATASSVYSSIMSINIIVIGTIISISLKFVDIIAVFRWMLLFVSILLALWLYISRKDNPLLRGDL